MDLDKDVLRIVTSLGREEKHFPYFFTELKTYPLSYSIYKNWFEFCFSRSHENITWRISNKLIKSDHCKVTGSLKIPSFESFWIYFVSLPICFQVLTAL